MPFIEIQKKQVYYATHGNPDNPILVLLNGLMMTTASWNHLIPELKKHYHVVCIDLHDMGQSQKMEPGYKHDIQVTCVANVIRLLTTQPVYICGTSYGGMIGLQLALTHPELVAKMMIFNTSAYTNATLRDIGRLWEKATASYDADTYYHQFAPLLYAPAYYESHYDAIYQRKELIRPFITKEYCDAIIRLSQSSVGYDIRDQLHRIHQEVLIVGSDSDYLTPLSDQMYLAQHLPSNQLIVIPQAGHGVIFEKVTLLATLMIGWFRKLDAQEVFSKNKT